MADHCNGPPSPRRSFSGNNKPTNQSPFNPKLQNAKGGSSKNFMFPTVSAAAKFTPSPKVKVSMERNELIRTSSHRKATFPSPKTENFPDSKTVPTEEVFVGSNGKKVRRSLSGFMGFSVILVLLVICAPSFVEFPSSPEVSDLYEQSRAVAESSRLSLRGSSVSPTVKGNKRAPLQFMQENAWNESYYSQQGVENVAEDDLDGEMEEEAYAVMMRKLQNLLRMLKKMNWVVKYMQMRKLLPSLRIKKLKLQLKPRNHEATDSSRRAITQRLERVL